MRCEGYRRYGGAFTLGPVKWEQCKNDAIAIIECSQDGETKEFPACTECWNEAIEKGIPITKSRPTPAPGDKATASRDNQSLLKPCA